MAGLARIVLPISDSSMNRMRRIGRVVLRRSRHHSASKPVVSRQSGTPIQRSIRRMASTLMPDVLMDHELLGYETSPGRRRDTRRWTLDPDVARRKRSEPIRDCRVPGIRQLSGISQKSSKSGTLRRFTGVSMPHWLTVVALVRRIDAVMRYRNPMRAFNWRLLGNSIEPDWRLERSFSPL